MGEEWKMSPRRFGRAWNVVGGGFVWLNGFWNNASSPRRNLTRSFAQSCSVAYVLRVAPTSSVQNVPPTPSSLSSGVRIARLASVVSICTRVVYLPVFPGSYTVQTLRAGVVELPARRAFTRAVSLLSASHTGLAGVVVGGHGSGFVVSSLTKLPLLSSPMKELKKVELGSVGVAMGLTLSASAR